MLADAFRRCLENCDALGLMTLWRHIAPHLPQPANAAEALVTLHHARTQAGSVALDKRRYSHHWLTERGYPSALPDDLRPKPERVEPRVVDAVGVAVKAGSPERKALAKEIERAMSGAVLEMYADGVTEPGRVKARMMEARARTLRRA